MKSKIKPKKIYVLLENIRSAENVGAILRTADAAGVSKIYLLGYTPSPLDRFGRENKKVVTRSLGAEKNIAWESIKEEDSEVLLRALQKEKVQIVAIEQDKKSIDYKKVKREGDTAFIFGNEVEGVSKKLLSLADTIAEIPMSGQKESLNVSVSVGIALFRILDL